MDEELTAFLVKVFVLIWHLPYGPWIALSLPLLYLLYVQLMRWERRREREKGLPWYGWVIYYGIRPPFAILDVFWNLLASIPFRDLPREWTLSQRLNRYTLEMKYDGTWRERWALKVAPLLNAHDPGHIRYR